MAVFLHGVQTTPQEKDLLKFVGDDEMIQQCLPSVKVHTPGLYTSKNQQKKKPKKKEEAD